MCGLEESILNAFGLIFNRAKSFVLNINRFKKTKVGVALVCSEWYALWNLMRSIWDRLRWGGGLKELLQLKCYVYRMHLQQYGFRKTFQFYDTNMEVIEHCWQKRSGVR